MAPTTGKKSASKRPARGTPALASKPPSEEESTPIPTDPTPEEPSQTLHSDLRTQADQRVSNTLGATVQLTDDQFRLFLEQLGSADRNLTIPTTERHHHNFQESDPDNSSSDNSSRSGLQGRPYRSRRSRSHKSYKKLSPKHDDPPKLDDGTSPTYVAWRCLLRGKLRANADWWLTEQDRLHYVFSRTEGKAQSYLEPRIDEGSLDPWLTVDDMLEYLGTVFRNHFEAEQSENAFYALKQAIGQDFHDFHTEFARLASTGHIPSSTWRSHLWRKLNKEFQNRLLATHHQHPTYQGLVRECQRLSVDLEEFHRQFPPTAQVQRRRPSTAAIARTGGSTLQLPSGVLPIPRRSLGPFQTLSPAVKRDSTTPGPRSSPAPADQSKATCFSCGEVGHFASSCPNPRATPRIHEIEQDIEEEDDDDEANDEDNADSESEN